jgi:hypothetical protein
MYFIEGELPFCCFMCRSVQDDVLFLNKKKKKKIGIRNPNILLSTAVRSERKIFERFYVD